MLCELWYAFLYPYSFSSSTFNLCSNHGRTRLFLLFKVLVMQAVLSPRFCSRFLYFGSWSVSPERSVKRWNFYLKQPLNTVSRIPFCVLQAFSFKLVQCQWPASKSGPSVSKALLLKYRWFDFLFTKLNRYQLFNNICKTCQQINPLRYAKNTLTFPFSLSLVRFLKQSVLSGLHLIATSS